MNRCPPGMHLALALALAFTLAVTTVRPARADVIHTYTRGETLAAISERYYGTVAHEAALVAANFLYIQQGPTLQTGVHLVIPSITWQRVGPGDTWERLATRLLGDGRCGAYLARINNGRFDLSPSPGTVIRVPYLLRYVITSEEPLFEIARRFYGDRAQVQFISDFNILPSQRLTRGQVLVLPLADVELRDPSLDTPTEPAAVGLSATHAAQVQVDRELPAFAQCIHRGQYVEAVALGARLAATPDLSAAQRVTLDRGLAEAYVALDRRDLAAAVLRDALTVDPSVTFDPVTTPPKVLDALILARGGSTSQAIAPPPPTARPDTAH